DLPLDLFRGSAGELRDDFDDSRGRIGIGFDVDVEKRVDADSCQRQGQQDHDQWIVQGDFDELTNHLHSPKALTTESQRTQRERHRNEKSKKGMPLVFYCFFSFSCLLCVLCDSVVSSSSP